MTWDVIFRVSASWFFAVQICLCTLELAVGWKVGEAERQTNRCTDGTDLVICLSYALRYSNGNIVKDDEICQLSATRV